MSFIDIIILLPVAYGFVRGLFRGLVGEITSLAAIILGIVGAKLWASTVAMKLVEFFDIGQQGAQILGYLLVFIVIALGLNLAGKLVEKLLSFIALGGVNKFLGGLFGAIKLALIMSVLLNGFDMLDETFSIMQPEQKEASVCYAPVKRVASVAWDAVNEGTDAP